jgi:phosphoglycolate phosphatase
MRLAIFDLDGTLVDSAPDIHAALDRLMASRGLRGFERAEVQAMIGDGAKVLVKRALAARGRDFDRTAFDDFLAYEEDGGLAPRLFPGIEDALLALVASGWRLAICTNKRILATRRMLDEIGLASRFAHVLGGDSLPVRKPDPGHVRGVLLEAGAAPGRAVMLGDHANDVLAAKGAGVASVFCAWGYGQDPGAAARCTAPSGIAALAESLVPP